MALDRQEPDDPTLGSVPARVEPSPLDTDEIPVVDLRPPPRSRASRTLALGTVALALAGLALASGLVLLFHYRPEILASRTSIVDLAEVSSFAFARDLHLWASHLLVVAAAWHLLWVVLTAAHRPPRHFHHRLGNYRLGLALFALLLLLATSGYVLPWDAHAGFLLTSLGELGGTAGDGFLLSVFALHCGILPLAFALLAIVHLRRARRDGAPEKEEE